MCGTVAYFFGYQLIGVFMQHPRLNLNIWTLNLAWQQLLNLRTTEKRNKHIQ